VKKSLVHKLPEMGVRDSKLLPRKKREQLYDSITNVAEQVKVSIIEAKEINEAMKNHVSLNLLEAQHFARLLDSLDDVSSFYIDSPDVIAARFGIRINALSNRPTTISGIKALRRRKGEKYIRIIAEHKADSRYPVVSAASIIAKVHRDHEIEGLSRDLGIDLGSGYPSDSKTIAAIKGNYRDKELNKYLRAYWKTADNIKQTRLPNFS
jgi:ribonuclease HII